MSDTIEIATGEFVPIQDTVCECGHWYDEHYDAGGPGCGAPGCGCTCFIADPAASTAPEIANRGGDPEQWPDHVKRAVAEENDPAEVALAAEHERERQEWIDSSPHGDPFRAAAEPHPWNHDTWAEHHGER